METVHDADQTRRMGPDAIAALHEKARHVAGRLGLLANPKRLMILCRLAEGEASVGELQGFVGLSQSALSQHLARLRGSGIVATRREGQTIHYRIADGDIRLLMAALYDVFCASRSEPG
jgi:DNA-binding transcriptional ArsR family regulator